MIAPATVATALAEARALGLDRLDAQLLLAHLLGQPRSWLFAHDDQALEEPRLRAFRDLCARRATGEPYAYLVGEKEFHGLALRVDPNVLVPRPDTEVLVDWALEKLAGQAQPRVLDLGTGSGAIAVAVGHARPDAAVMATDISPQALGVARANASRYAVSVEFREGAWWEPVGARHFDLVLSNPPYIAGADPHLVALTHEPIAALTPGGDGLAALREIIAGACAHLLPEGWLLLEHGYDQAEAVQALLAAQGFEAVETRRDLGGQPRCTGGRLAATP